METKLIAKALVGTVGCGFVLLSSYASEMTGVAVQVAGWCFIAAFVQLDARGW